MISDVGRGCTLPIGLVSAANTAPVPEVTRFADRVAIANGGQGVIEPPTTNEMVPLGVDIPRILVHCGIHKCIQYLRSSGSRDSVHLAGPI